MCAGTFCQRYCTWFMVDSNVKCKDLELITETNKMATIVILDQ